MTKNEVLESNDPSAIWAAMQADPSLKKERDVWMHLTHLTHEREKANMIQKFGYYEFGLHIDYNKRKKD